MMLMTAAMTTHRAQFRVLLHKGKHKRRAGQAAKAPIMRRIPFGTSSSARAAFSLFDTHCTIKRVSSW